MPSVYLHIFSCLIILWVLKRVKNAYFTPLAKLPNAHFSVPFLTIWNLLNKWHGFENRARLAAHRKYGPVVRIGPSEVSIDCFDDGIRTVYGHNFQKSAWYTQVFGEYELPPLLFLETNSKAHAHKRRMLSSLYTKSSIQNSADITRVYESVLSNHLASALRSWAATHQPVDVLERSRACLMDITTAFTFGLANGINDANVFWSSEFPILTKNLERISIHLTKKAAKEAFDKLIDWWFAMCQRAEESLASSNTNEKPVVYAHLHSNLKKSDLPPSEQEALLWAETLDNTIASIEGGGITLAYLMWELSKRPALQASLRKEIRTLSSANRARSSTSLAQAIDNLPLLDAILTETLRLHTANPGPWPRIVPESGCQLGEYANIPGGTIVSATTWTLHRNPSVFPKPEEWKPERWLEATAEEKTEMMKWFWAFGSGARMCLGTHFAVRSMKAFIATVYGRYETSIADDTGIEHFDGFQSMPVANKLFLIFHDASD